MLVALALPTGEDVYVEVGEDVAVWTIVVPAMLVTDGESVIVEVDDTTTMLLKLDIEVDVIVTLPRGTDVDVTVDGTSVVKVVVKVLKAVAVL